MTETTTELIGDVYTIKGITGSRQLIEFYREVVKGNYEKYVAITRENIKYGYDSELNRPVRLANNVDYAINPNYKPIEIKVEEPLKIEPVENTVVEETVEQEPVIQEQPVIEEQPEQEQEQEVSPYVYPTDDTIPTKDEPNYKQLYDESLNEIQRLNSELALQKERADYSEKDNTKLRELKIINEGRIAEFETDYKKLSEENESLKQKNIELQQSISNNSIYTDLDTDTLISHLAAKGYKVSITR